MAQVLTSRMTANLVCLSHSQDQRCSYSDDHDGKEHEDAVRFSRHAPRLHGIHAAWSPVPATTICATSVEDAVVSDLICALLGFGTTIDARDIDSKYLSLSSATITCQDGTRPWQSKSTYASTSNVNNGNAYINRNANQAIQEAEEDARKSERSTKDCHAASMRDFAPQGYKPTAGCGYPDTTSRRGRPRRWPPWS